MRLLESLKLYLDVPGCVYVLGVDREPLEAAVAVQYKALGLRTESYLDKIIQLPFSIPAIDEEAMLTFITERLPDALDGCQELLAAAAADEPRSVKRLTNALLVNHELAEESVFPQPYDVRTLAVLVLIQNLAPDLYRQVRLDPALFGEVFLHRDAPPPPAPDGADVEHPDMWRNYIEPKPRLERALRTFQHDPARDVRPYLTLTSLAVAESTTGRFEEPQPGTVRLVATGTDVSWSKRIQDALEGVGWRATAVQRVMSGVSYGHQAADEIDALVLAVGRDWLRGEVPEWARSEVADARAAGIPILPVALDGVDVQALTYVLDGDLAFLSEIQFTEMADATFERDIANLERLLRYVTPGSRIES